MSSDYNEEVRRRHYEQMQTQLAPYGGTPDEGEQEPSEPDEWIDDGPPDYTPHWPHDIKPSVRPILEPNSSFGSVMTCPTCGMHEMHPVGLRAVFDGETTIVGRGLRAASKEYVPPSDDRIYEREHMGIEMVCEHCSGHNTLVVAQYKGCNYIGWATPLASCGWAGDEDDEDDDADPAEHSIMARSVDGERGYLVYRDNQTNAACVLMCMCDGQARRTREVAEIVQRSTNAIGRTITDLYREGWLERVDRGLYRATNTAIEVGRQIHEFFGGAYDAPRHERIEARMREALAEIVANGGCDAWNDWEKAFAADIITSEEPWSPKQRSKVSTVLWRAGWVNYS